MNRISPTLYSDLLDEEKPITVAFQSPFAEYVDALIALDEGNLLLAKKLVEQADPTSFFSLHIRIRFMMEAGEYAEAKALLSKLLNSEDPLNEIYLYVVLCELEVCCREIEDFKMAYTYANDKVQLLEQLLKEL